LVSRILRVVPESRRVPLLSGVARSIIVAGAFAVLLVPLVPMVTGGYVVVHDQSGKEVPHDLYKLPLTTLQAQQLAFIRQNIPPSAHIIMDDDLWVQLHDVRPYTRLPTPTGRPRGIRLCATSSSPGTGRTLITL